MNAGKQQQDLRRVAEDLNAINKWSVDVESPTRAWSTVRVTVASGDRFVSLFEDNEEICYVSSGQRYSTPAPDQSIHGLVQFVERMLQ